MTTQTAEEKKKFEQITEAADFLIRVGEVEVYSQTKEEFVSEEELLAQRRRAQFAGQSEEKNEEKILKKEIMWEYKATDGQIHGPFPTSNFVAWQQQVGFAVGISVNWTITWCLVVAGLFYRRDCCGHAASTEYK